VISFIEFLSLGSNLSRGTLFANNALSERFIANWFVELSDPSGAFEFYKSSLSGICQMHICVVTSYI
jgi:hypothetical protein